MTLRARLVGVLLVLIALGLRVAGALTYRETRTFLVDRVDAPLERSVRAPQQSFEDLRGVEPQGSYTLPPGQWAELRSLDGTEITRNRGALPGLDEPQVPDDLQPGDVVSVKDPHYRVLAGNAGEVLVRVNGVPQPATLVVAIPMSDVDDTL